MQMREERPMGKREFGKWLTKDPARDKHWDAPMLRMLVRLCKEVVLLPPKGQLAEQGKPYGWVRLVFEETAFCNVHWNEWDSFDGASCGIIADVLLGRVRELERQLRQKRKA